MMTETETKYFRWAYAAIVALAKEELNRGDTAPGIWWGKDQRWEDLSGTSKSILLRHVRNKVGIPDDEFLHPIREGYVNITDLYEGKIGTTVAERDAERTRVD